MKESRPDSAPRIIIADDHKWIRQALLRMVVQTLPDAEPVVVEDGLEALRAYQQGGADFLITDYRMPCLDGVALIRRLRETERRLPILLVSVQPEVRAAALAAGASWFLNKADIPEGLPELLRRHARCE